MENVTGCTSRSMSSSSWAATCLKSSLEKQAQRCGCRRHVDHQETLGRSERRMLWFEMVGAVLVGEDELPGCWQGWKEQTQLGMAVSLAWKGATPDDCHLGAIPFHVRPQPLPRFAIACDVPHRRNPNELLMTLSIDVFERPEELGLEQRARIRRMEPEMKDRAPLHSLGHEESDFVQIVIACGP